MSRIKQIKMLTVVGLLSIGSVTFARGGGADVGGGDIIRAYFLNVGDAVISYLVQSKDGQKLVLENKLDVVNLKKSLDVKFIQVVDGPLIDRTGSLVDATGKPGEIKLNKTSWTQHLNSDLDIYFLVFHEMLRENGINDDNYMISAKISPFPEAYRLKKGLASAKELIAADRLSDTINKDEITFAGSGCPSTSHLTFSRFDSTSNQFEIFPKEMSVVVESKGRTLDRKSCQLAIPYKAAKGKKVIITQVDLAGEVESQVQTSVDLTFEAFAAGSQGKIQTKTIVDSQSGGFLFRENTAFASDCGGEGILRLNSAALAREVSNGANEKPTFAKVNKITVSFKIATCVARTK